jgi:hypothetical protein
MFQRRVWWMFQVTRTQRQPMRSKRRKCECDDEFHQSKNECGCLECRPDDYEDAPTYTLNWGGGDLKVSFSPCVYKGCEFCVGTYCHGYKSCECPKCKPEKYDRLIVLDIDMQNIYI